ncbi:LTA synthase family protein [Aeromonas rivipollensis]|uniref:LTA synthase family protein n=1 Tax=Aeromonas rivipollensis TaxID=948519 RepID=UPI00259DC6F9|nr:LTA synthase family protein [Aeromonas rivipollensis]MDM5083292.1 LTA synthase family protein [Aeromonas rivipollensis]MDM5095670.1 LTA synthase family protein [Aeromonas rivipollensis]MDM5107914.1 LTA synthase family protein [Aeromonas rivipollensis]
MNAPVCDRPPSSSQSLAGWLFGLLIALLLLTLALPLLNPAGWLGQAQPLILGPTDQPIATLSRHSLLYKSDSRGLYLVVRSQWQLLKPLQAGDKVRVELLNDKGIRIDQLSQAVEKRQKCRQERCTLDLNSALRAPDDALDSRYQLRIGLLLADRPESAEYSQILQTLPERGFNLVYLMTSLLLVLLVSAAVLRGLMPRLRRSYRSRVLGSLLLGNLTFVLLHGFVVFKLGEFLLWSGFRPEHYYLAWGSMVLGWSLCALAGFNLYMGLVFTALSGIGLLANFMKIAIYGVPLGGDDLGNLMALLHILLDQHPVLPVLAVLGLLFLCWRFALSRWILRTAAATAAFFALCVFATQTGNKLLGANIRYVDRAVNYHRDIIRAGPGLYLFNLVDEMLQSGNIFRYPLQINERTPELSQPAPGQPPRFDLVIVLQYESLWLDWQGKICAPAPTLSLPTGVAQWHKTIHSPTTGGMTVLAEFEMNTGLPVGLLKQGVVPYYYLSDKVPGLAQSARQNGYQTLFAHPYVEKFWGRAKAIPALGYQERWFDTRFTTLEHKGLYISDDALIDHLLRRSEQDSQPLFAYAVTMQGHGPFDGDRYRAQQLDRACPDQSPADRQLLNTYYTGVVDAMASLERLLKTLDRSGKRYLVVAFGDHQPFLMSAGKNIHGAKPPRDAPYQIPMMAFTRNDGAITLERQFAPVRQLYQMGQATRALLAGDLTPIEGKPVLHPVLGEEKGFDPSPLVPQIRASFRADALP